MTNIDLLQERAINLKSKGLSTRKIAKEMGIGQTKAWKLTKYIYDGKQIIINLCPHEVIVGDKRYQSMGFIRSDTTINVSGEIDGVKVFYEKSVPLPGLRVDRNPGYRYIISRFTAKAYPDRDDFYVVHKFQNKTYKENEVEGIVKNPFWRK